MNKYQKDVQAFHAACGIHIGDYNAPKISRKDLRVALIREESSELLDGIRTESLSEIIDACIDLAYVVYGAAVEYGVDLGDDEFADVEPILGPPAMRIRTSTCAQIKHNTNLLCSALQLDPAMEDWFYIPMHLIEICHKIVADCGVEFEDFWDEVHGSNMRKISGGVRADGKRLKPPGWVPPRIDEMLKDRGWIGDRLAA